jgi:hypothetical protein
MADNGSTDRAWNQYNGPPPRPSVGIAVSQSKKRERMRTQPRPEAFAYGIDIGKKVVRVVAVIWPEHDPC